MTLLAELLKGVHHSWIQQKQNTNDVFEKVMEKYTVLVHLVEKLNTYCQERNFEKLKLPSVAVTSTIIRTRSPAPKITGTLNYTII